MCRRRHRASFGNGFRAIGPSSPAYSACCRTPIVLNRQILAESGHIFKYYDPTLHIQPLSVLSTDQGGIFIRENYAYTNVTNRAAAGAYSAVVLQKRHLLRLEESPTLAPSFISPATKDSLENAYPHQKVVYTFWVFTP